MEYNNLDAILARAEKFNKTSDRIFDSEKYVLAELEAAILDDERLIKIFKTIRFLKDAHPADLNFNEIKNFDPYFVCDGVFITIKFLGCPIEYKLSYDDDDNHFYGSASGLDDRYTDEFRKFFYKTRDYIDNYANNFIKKLNNILQNQDNKFKKVLPYSQI
jgi:hypothetical protein